MRKRLIGAIVVLLSTTVVVGQPVGADPQPAAPAAGQVVPGRFIVTLKPGVDSRAVASEYRRRGAAVNHVYSAATSGFSGRLSDREASAARTDGRVLRVEPDRVVVADDATQAGATWGLDRLDERPLAPDGTYTYATTASNVTAYIIDSGIRATHTEVAGRVASGYTAIADGLGTKDCNGHGTHVAGTVGGRLYGVAKGVRLVPVRVLACNGTGTSSGVIAGVDWITANAVKPAVANMSLGGGASASLDDAVRRSIASGVTYTVSAGNEGVDACTKSPARVAEGLTIGATDRTDTKAPYSNSGTCLDLFAPGSAITSASISSDTTTATMSGTSMAAPHVAGVAALHLAVHPTATPKAVGDAIIANTTPGVVKLPGGGSPVRLLHARWPAAPVVTAPTTTTTAPAPTTTTTVPPATTTTTTTAPVITLSARPYVALGYQRVDLTWSGATGDLVDVHRGTTRVATGTANDGSYTDKLSRLGSASLTYKVCRTGSTACSGSVTVTF